MNGQSCGCSVTAAYGLILQEYQTYYEIDESNFEIGFSA